jgi:hypothetical protein
LWSLWSCFCVSVIQNQDFPFRVPAKLPGVRLRCEEGEEGKN